MTSATTPALFRRCLAPALLALGTLLATSLATARPASEEVDLDTGARLGASLLADLDEARRPLAVGVLFELPEGWHLYWHHPGDSGLPPVLDFSFPGSDARAGEIAWPAPRAFREDEDLVTYGYEGRVLLAAPTLRGEAPPAWVTVEAHVLACADQCVPASFSLALDLRRLPDTATRDGMRSTFEQFAAQVPGSATERGLRVEAVAFERRAGPPERFHAALRVQGCAEDARSCRLGRPDARADFHPYAPEGWQLRVAPPERDPDVAHAWRISVRGERFPDVEPEALPQLRGVLVETTGSETHAVEIALPLRDGPPAQAAPAGAVLLRALLAGFLGGLILNLMPCVLPVLAIKLFALAELSQQNRRDVFANAGAYTAGILATLLALAGVVIALRAGGQAVGWGFHLQEPGFVAFVAAVVVAFAMNLLGVFEIEVDTGRLGGVGAQATGARRSFFDGLLAVVLATPCSAPFLGTAVGVAFASPAPVIAGIFAAIGLGLAAPFVAVALLPSGARFVPRPGKWMLELRRVLGFALLLTAVWLLWVVGRASGVDAMAALLALLLAVAACAHAFGRWQHAGRRTPAWMVVGALALVFAAGLDRIDLTPRPARPQPGGAGAPVPFTPEALEAHLAGGAPAFVSFTADWCLTCKVNERRVLADPRVTDALASAGITHFRADWTRRDETIRAALAQLGRAGVPAYALYAPHAKDAPRVLPELLTTDLVVEAVQRLDAETRAARTAGAPGA
jgi:thiol:disulfide interchange protein/DsbC/DsbD-like thiol-disulfide interchange protein